jgi:hypothetical protein
MTDILNTPNPDTPISDTHNPDTNPDSIPDTIPNASISDGQDIKNSDNQDIQKPNPDIRDMASSDISDIPNSDISEMDYFTEPTIYTSTGLYYYSGTSKSPEELVKILEPEGEIKVINTNFGSKAQKGWEFKQVTTRKTRKPKKHPDGAEKIVTARKIQGHGGCFGSALELIIVPDLDIAPKSIVDVAEQKYEELIKIKKNKLNENRCSKFYVIEVFTSAKPLGTMQIMGITDQNLENGKYIANICTRFLNKEGVNDNILPGSGENAFNEENRIKVLLDFPTLVNCKFRLNIGSNYKFSIDVFTDILKETKLNPPEDLPFIIVNINPVSEKQVASFRVKMKNPKLIAIPPHIAELEAGLKKDALIAAINNNNKKHLDGSTNIKFWFTGKVNILNARNHDAAMCIFRFFNETVRANPARLLFE